MGITERIMQKRFAPGKGVTGPPPDKGVRRFVFLIAAHAWRLIALSLLFLLFSVPVMTMPAAFCGMNRVLINLTREGNCFLFGDFWDEFKANLLKGLPFGLLHAFLLFDAYFAISLAASAPSLDIPMLALGLLLLGCAALFSSYVFCFLPSLSLNNRQLARNAFIFMLTEWKTNLVILGGTLALSLITAALMPYSLMLLPFFSFWQLAVCMAVNEPMQRRIVGPYEQAEKAAAQKGTEDL